MFRISVLVLSIMLASCATATTQTPDRPGRVDAPIPAATATLLFDDESREIDRWLAICRGNPLDFYDNRDYCLRIEPWATYAPPFKGR